MTGGMADSQRSAARTGIALRDPWNWRDMAELVATAEETGFAALFLPEIAGREAFSTLSAVAGETRVARARNRRRDDAWLAARSRRPWRPRRSTSAPRDGWCLALARGPAGPGSLERLRDYARTVRALLDGREARAESGRPMRLSMPPPPGRRIPIWIAALGPRAMRLAGELADGVLLNWCPPERVAFARDRVREGAEAAGRDPEAVTVAVYVRACVGQDEEEAMSAIRRAAAEYASMSGLPAAIRGRRARRGGPRGCRGARGGAIPRMSRTPSCEPSPWSEARARRSLASRHTAEAGAELPIVYPVPCLDPRSSVLGTLFATAPHPALTS